MSSPRPAARGPRAPAAPGGAAAAAAGRGAARSRPALLGRRPGLRHRVPPPRDRHCPAPGTSEQLGEQVARIHARPLDRTRPLWEMYLIHNVSRGGRQAIYTKVHHAAIDGVSGAEILATIMDVTVEPRVEEQPRGSSRPGPLPGSATLIAEGCPRWRRSRSTCCARSRSRCRISPSAGRGLIPGRRSGERRRGLGGADGDGRCARTPELDVVRSRPRPHRSTRPSPRTDGSPTGRCRSTRSRPSRTRFGMTVNDVVMALCTTALRRWLLDHDGAARRTDRRRGAGVGPHRGPDRIERQPGLGDARRDADAPRRPRGPAGRRAGGMAAAKEHFDAVPASILQDFSAVIPTALSGLAARAIFSMVTVGAFPFNLFISNVPGPQLPLYVGGARGRWASTRRQPSPTSPARSTSRCSRTTARSTSG